MENQIQEAYAMKARWKKFAEQNPVGSYANRGIGVMSERERNFLLSENAIGEKNGIDFINADKPYAVSYERGQMVYTELVENFESILGVSKEKKFVPYKYNLWILAKGLNTQ